ncbi:exosortase N [Desertivirga arenae]|uniref:exosortase N n=1 Tax=Desertivirga arenae TaxID=2810309 RepID=UPI001A96FBF3|nr:exosortase N [Pedobacter sp. SYSU D00823]
MINFALVLLRPTFSKFSHLVVLFYLSIGLVAFRNYFIWDATTVCGFLLLPLIFRLNACSRSMRFLPLSLLSAVLAIFFPVNSCLFLAAIFALMFFTETYIGKINVSAVLTLLIVSPVFKFFINTFGFPLRLWLSDIAANIFSISGLPAKAEGNIININQNSFTVEQACAGLSMLSISLVICLFLIAHWESRVNKRIKVWQIFGLLTLSFFLNLSGNLIRILFLVLLRVEPDNIFHDLIGVTCLIVYTVLPLMYFAKWLVKRGNLIEHPTNKINNNYPPLLVIHFILFSIILYVSLNLSSIDNMNTRTTRIHLNGFDREIMDNKIVKFSNKSSLIYFKPSVFYAPDHDPKICWRGSGYMFDTVKEDKVLNYNVYTGILKKGKEKLYTAWWYSSGNTTTTNQFEWRWKSAVSNEEFYLINVTAGSEKEVLSLVRALISKPFPLRNDLSSYFNKFISLPKYPDRGWLIIKHKDT